MKIYFNSLTMLEKLRVDSLRTGWILIPYSDKIETLAIVHFHVWNLRVKKVISPSRRLLSVFCFQAFFMK